MKRYATIRETSPACASTAVALGYFDGLHIGHAAVIGRAIARAKEGMCACVFTFTMHTAHPQAKQEGSDLVTEEEKYRILEQWGVSLVLAPDFSEFRDMSPEEYVDEVLVKRLHAKAICCGHDFRFGRHASAGVIELAALCDARGIEIDIVPAVKYEGKRISSTWIRELIGRGEVDTAAKLLGRAFGYDFTVVPGKKLGRTIDSPTINQRLPNGFVAMRHGVYASASMAEGKWYPSVTNVGVRPTVEDSRAVNSETYLYGFSGDLYGKKVQVRLLKFLRDEQRFASVDQLKEQIQRDTQDALPYARTYITAL